MKIVHISTTYTGGAGIAALRLHKTLLDNHIDSHFIQSKPIKDIAINDNIYRATYYHNFKYRILNKVNLLSYFFDKELWERKINKNNKNYEIASLPYSYYNLHEHPLIKSADIIHLHWVADFVDYPSFFQNIKKPIVWTFHDMNPFLGIFHYENDIFTNSSNMLDTIEKEIRYKKKKILSDLKNITLVSPSNWLLQKCNTYKTFNFHCRQLVIPNPITRINSDVNKFNILNTNPTIFFIADYVDVYRKGFDLLEEALIKFDISPINILILGSGNISKKLKKNDYLNIISFNKTSDRNFINSLYYASDFTIIPSREDNLPNVMLESFMNGTPVISFSNGGMSEYINQQTGILIDTEVSSSNLKIAIEKGIKNKNQFNRNYIKKFYDYNFSFENTTKKYIDLYNSLIYR